MINSNSFHWFVVSIRRTVTERKKSVCFTMTLSFACVFASVSFLFVFCYHVKHVNWCQPVLLQYSDRIPFKLQVSRKKFRTKFDANKEISLEIVGSICNELGIPHIIAHWTPGEVREEQHAYTRNFFPDNNLYARALAQIIADYEWNGFTLLYENNESE